MAEPGEPRTLLGALVRQRQLSWDEAADLVVKTARKHEGISISLSGRHLGRLARSERSGTRPNPVTRRALQYTFNRPVDELLGPYILGDLTVVTDDQKRGTEASEVLTVAADRARRFMTSLQTLSDESLQLINDEVRDLVCAYPTRPLPEILGHLASDQEAVFSLLERPQRPTHARQLYFLSAVLGGLLAKASHDLADPHAALAQSRTAWLCAERADHDGLRAWISGLQSLICYWARRPHDSIRYAQRGAVYSQHASNTAMVLLPASEARAWAVLGNVEQARDAIERAERAWAGVRTDEMDEMGGLATFSRPRQLYFAADTLVWLPDVSAGESSAAEDHARQAVEAYSDQSDPHWAFGDAAGSHAVLAIARIRRGEIDGAADVLTPVLDLPTEQRINGIVHSVNRVHRALSHTPTSATARELQERIECYTQAPVRMLAR
ncbi:MAG: XRE family transcriptional regulator [Actinobacteria bacterium]|nr:XRE family transcriptional regulator [Actinomycetota bacterium]